MRLFERCLIRMRIDQEQLLSLGNFIALLEIDGVDPAVDPRRYIYRVDRLNSAQCGHNRRYILALSPGGDYRNCRVGVRPGGGSKRH